MCWQQLMWVINEEFHIHWTAERRKKQQYFSLVELPSCVDVFVAVCRRSVVVFVLPFFRLSGKWWPSCVWWANCTINGQNVYCLLQQIICKVFVVYESRTECLSSAQCYGYTMCMLTRASKHLNTTANDSDRKSFSICRASETQTPSHQNTKCTKITSIATTSWSVKRHRRPTATDAAKQCASPVGPFCCWTSRPRFAIFAGPTIKSILRLAWVIFDWNFAHIFPAVFYWKI